MPISEGQQEAATTTISTTCGSLRFGLLVPCLGALLMITLARAGLRHSRLSLVPEPAQPQ